MSAINIQLADESHLHFVKQICDEMESSAKIRGTGIAKRSTEYLEQKIKERKAVIAFDTNNQWAGFCYIETWQSGEYVANSGLIISPVFRKQGVAKLIKEKIFKLSQTKYPNAKIFGLTTGLAVMKINSELGYEPVTYSELTNDEQFWNGCKSCVNYSILTDKEFKNCLCTAMLYKSNEKKAIQIPVTKPRQSLREKPKMLNILGRLTKLKQSVFLKVKTNHND